MQGLAANAASRLPVSQPVRVSGSSAVLQSLVKHAGRADLRALSAVFCTHTLENGEIPES